MTTEEPLVLGGLTAADLGRTLSFSDGGATYAGALTAVQHDSGFKGPRTCVTLKAGAWRHIKTYPADTPCEFVA